MFKITTGGSGYKTLYSFKGPPNDGVTPFAGLTDVGGVLYGTTQYGGTGSCSGAVAGCGTVFRIPTAGGGYKTLYSFKGPPNDGAFPLASLTDVSGVLYGTTFQGGAGNCTTLGLQGCGTVFKITTAGAEEVLHSFDCCSGDGSLPAGGLIAIGSSLYGTTADGGIDGDGTVFKITTGGSVEVLYSFGGPIDGALPLAGLTEIGGVLYGTTFSGGTGNGGVGNGTVFKITTAGVETVLHLFKGPNTDGSNPYYSGLIDFKGELYGTTSIGGKSSLGTVFKIAP